MITLYNENDVQIRNIRIYEINDADMGESTITATVKFDQVMQFHPDWYVLLNGEKYKLGITEPSGKRSTTRINVEYTLIFHSSREDLKRYTFMDFVEYGSGNPQPSQHTFSLQACTLGQLVNRFNINLQYYLGSLWTMELSKDADPSVVADLSFDKASLWDVLTELYKDYGVRWTIRSNEGYMTILVGEDATELQTIFEYGKGNGLISVERTNPTERIVTRLRGKGSEKNLPANYFHAATSAFPIADPDTNSVLQGIFYNRLYPKCYRDYVRGYNSGEEDVEETWAYHQGVADKVAGKPMNIVDFAKSDNEALWGISYGAVEDNDEIYPTLQGATRDGVELDKVLAVSPIYVDAPDDGEAARQFTQVNGAKGSFQGRDTSIRVNGRDGGISTVLGISNAKSETADSETFTLETDINTVRAKFLVTPTKFADHYASAVGVTDPESPTLTTVVEMVANNWNFVERLQLIDATTGDVVRTWNGNNQDFFDVVADDIPAGTYKFRSYIQWYKTTGTTQDRLLYTIDWQLYGCEYATYQNAISKKTFSETFDIWIGNVWNTSKQESESDEAYACRVWAPLVSKEELTVMFSDGLLAGEDYEFPIVGLVNDSDNLAEIIKKAIHYDTSVTGSHWRLTLQKSDAEFEASGKYLPNSVINVLPGNHFFFINIQMPYDPYIYDAERRQQEYLEDQLSLLDVEQPTFAVVPSSVFMASLDEVDNVVPGNKIRLRDASLIGSSYTTAYIQSITKRYTENKINPDWSLVVSDQIIANGNPITLIEGKVDAISKQMYSSKQAIKDAIEAFAQFYLRKDGLPDASFSATDFRAPVTFRDRITDYNFRQGDFGGYGFGVYTDPDGNRVVEADVLVGRVALRVNEFIFDQVEYVGGQKIYSAAAMTVSKVESTATIWRCYFDNKQGTVRNMFLAGDLAFCQRFNGTEEGGYTTYWAKVTAIGSDYIELSKTDLMSAGSGSPAVGDNIIQLGNASDQDRQSAIILSSYGSNSPSIRLYYGITDYTLANKDIFGVEYDSTNHIPYFYNYGSMRLGAKEGEDGGYIAYDHKTKQLNINAVVNFLPQSTGLEQMEAYQKLVQIAQGNIETWFYDGVSPIQSGAPTMSNYPVNTWEAADYENHIGDIYYSNTGKGYRFKRSGSTWEWEIISDAEMAQLMAEVQNLQYLKTALSDGTTTVAGGLILTSLIQLGYKDAENVRHIMAGISGLGQNSTTPAAWFGGPMVDHELNPDATEFAKSLFRFDGTGYLASGNITWDNEGYGSLGGGFLTWGKNADGTKYLKISDEVKFGEDDTVESVLYFITKFDSMFGIDKDGDIYVKNGKGFYTEGFISAGAKGTSGGGSSTYTQKEWLQIKEMTESASGILASAYAVKEAYNELNTAIETLAGKATNVIFSQTLTSGKQIGSISIDGKSTSLFAPANYAWSEVTGKPAFATVATSGSYTDLTNKPTIASLMGSAAIGGTSSFIYWNGSAFVSKALGTNAFTSISKVSQLTNDSGYISGITKSMVEAVLTGDITSHTHSQYLTTHQPIYALTIQKNGTTAGTYTPNSQAATINISDVASAATLSSHTTNTTVHITANERTLWNKITGLFDVDTDGDVYVKNGKGFYTEGFISAGAKGTSGGGSSTYTQKEWAQIKDMTATASGSLASAYAVKEAYSEAKTLIDVNTGNITSLTSRVTTLEGKATAVSFSQTLTSGTKIGAITVDGTTTNIYAPTLASQMGSTAIGGTSSYLYWNGSAWATKALGSNAFTSISKVSQLTNDSGYITGITKSMVEGVLTGNITSHTHSYLPLSGGTMSNTNVVTNLNADLLDGYRASSFSKTKLIDLPVGQVLRISVEDRRGFLISMQGPNGGRNALYFVTGYGVGTIVRNDVRVIKGGPYDLYFNGESENACVYIVGTSLNATATDYIYINPFDYNDITYTIVSSVPSDAVLVSSSNSNILATLDSNVASSSKWATARTITLTGSVTGSVSIDGSQNVTLATTTNHTHTFDSLTSKPTTISGYGITDAYTKTQTDTKLSGYLPLTGGTLYSNSSSIVLNLKAPGSAVDSIIRFSDATTSEIYEILLRRPTTSFGLQCNINGNYYNLIHSGNYNSYAPKLDGTGASGTWNININGYAGALCKANNITDLNVPSWGLTDGFSINYNTCTNTVSNAPSAVNNANLIMNIQNGLHGTSGQYGWQVGFFNSLNSPYVRKWSAGNLGAWYKLLHSGNYNEFAPSLTGVGATGTWGISISGNAATATDADTLDGYHASQVLTANYSDTVDLNEISVPSIYRLSSQNPNLPSSIFSYGNLLTVKYHTVDTAWQLIGSYSSDNLWFRRGTWYADGKGTLRTNAWKVIAFTDSNVASATKLATSRTIWGQSFDGTGNVSGALTGVTDIKANGVIYSNRYNSSGNTAGAAFVFNKGGDLFGIGVSSGRVSNVGFGTVTGIDGTWKNEIMTITNTNNVGIGTTSPAYKLHIAGVAYASEGLVSDGYISAASTSTSSDIRLKDNISEISSEMALKWLLMLKPKSWTWNSLAGVKGQSMGFVAQDIESILPQMIRKRRDNDYLSLDYTQLHALEVSALQSHEKRIEELERENKILKEELNKLKLNAN